MNAVLTTPIKQFTPSDLLQMPDQGKGFELVDGELREQNVSFLSSFVAGEVFGFLRDHVKPRGLGWVTPEGTSYRCFRDDPSRVRRADTAFHKLPRITAEQAQAEGHCSIVPDLVVEVISPHDLAGELSIKRNQWLKAGVQLIWIIDPLEETVEVYRADGTTARFGPTDTLTAEPVLPEFRVAMSDLFRLPPTGN